ncbi:hypothetical protein B9Z19DRAFT_1084901 [Tuber borchii]|uniref:Uncharacterized protein n=1 Tax=Tuber borchii TaxID=42251 RepID=A0A2T6ZRC9_TUBBO|nr:hypothetical protein B9Z19DRAFT_1084901 [Tuber borchii]
MNLSTRGKVLLRVLAWKRPVSLLHHQHRRRTFADVRGRTTSPHVMFYKDFGRPIAKVFLMAFFTYQVTYWAWVKMEKEDAKVEKEKEVSALEEEVVRLRAGIRSGKMG